MTNEYQYNIEEDESMTHAVIQAVASLLDNNPRELPPLYDSVDPEALNAIFSHRDQSSQLQGTEIKFTYLEQEITIQNGTILYISQIDDQGRSLG